MKLFLQLTVRLILVYLFISNSALSSETDQYLTINESMSDSTSTLNKKMNQKIRQALIEINSKRNWRRISCDRLTNKIMWKFRFLVVHKIEFWAQFNLDVFPPHEVSNSEYMEMSIHDNGKKFNTKKIVPLARTLQVNGIKFGTDKLGHFVSLGHKYFKKFQEQLKQNKSEEDALAFAIQYGIDQEKGWIGAKISGVRSYADLEANYRGMLFVKSLCHDKYPRIEKTSGGWKLVRPLNMKEYVNPYWDESYNLSTYTEKKWRKVSKNLQKYCRLLDENGELQRSQPYSAIPRSINMELIRKEEERGGLPLQSEFSLKKACSEPLFSGV